MEFRQDRQIIKELGERFRQVRLSHEMSQEELATKAGVSRDMIRRFEKNGATTLAGLVKLCRALGETTQLDEIFKLHSFSPRNAFEEATQRKRTKHKRRRTPSSKETVSDKVSPKPKSKEIKQ